MDLAGSQHRMEAGLATHAGMALQPVPSRYAYIQRGREAAQAFRGGDHLPRPAEEKQKRSKRYPRAGMAAGMGVLHVHKGTRCGANTCACPATRTHQLKGFVPMEPHIPS